MRRAHEIDKMDPTVRVVVPDGNDDLSEAFNSLLKSAYGPLEEKTIDFDYYHYASVQSLLGIIESNTMWFTDYRFLNDPEEGKVVKSVLKEVVEDLLKISAIDEEFRIQLELSKPYDPSLKRVNIRPIGHENDANRSMYIASFSKNKNDLALWSYYSQNNGCSIGFRRGDFKCDNVSIVEVIYDKEKQKQIVKDIVLSVYNNPFRKKFPGVIHNIMELVLTQLMLIFKNEAFSFEQEVRAIYEGDVDRDRIYYRIKDSLVIPYIRIPLNKKRFDILCGPLSKEKRTWEGIRHLLETKKIEGEVWPSNTNLRY